jgi:biotin carboxylase
MQIFFDCTHPASRIEALCTRINRHRCPTFYDLSCCSTMYCPLTTWFATSNSSDRALDEFVIEDITTTIPLHPRLFAARVSSPMRYEIGGIASGECPNV